MNPPRSSPSSFSQYQSQSQSFSRVSRSLERATRVTRNRAGKDVGGKNISGNDSRKGNVKRDRSRGEQSSQESIKRRKVVDPPKPTKPTTSTTRMKSSKSNSTSKVTKEIKSNEKEVQVDESLLQLLVHTSASTTAKDDAMYRKQAEMVAKGFREFGIGKKVEIGRAEIRVNSNTKSKNTSSTSAADPKRILATPPPPARSLKNSAATCIVSYSPEEGFETILQGISTISTPNLTPSQREEKTKTTQSPRHSQQNKPLCSDSKNPEVTYIIPDDTESWEPSQSSIPDSWQVQREIVENSQVLDSEIQVSQIPNSQPQPTSQNTPSQTSQARSTQKRARGSLLRHSQTLEALVGNSQLPLLSSLDTNEVLSSQEPLHQTQTREGNPLKRPILEDNEGHQSNKAHKLARISESQLQKSQAHNPKTPLLPLTPTKGKARSRVKGKEKRSNSQSSSQFSASQELLHPAAGSKIFEFKVHPPCNDSLSQLSPVAAGSSQLPDSYMSTGSTPDRSGRLPLFTPFPEPPLSALVHPHEIFCPPPKTNSNPKLLTAYLQETADSGSWRKYYLPTQTRELRPMERGCWVVDTSTWVKKDKLQFWNWLKASVEAGRCGAVTVFIKEETRVSFGREVKRGDKVEIYCWGQVADVMWGYICLMSNRKTKTGLQWIDARGEVVIKCS